MTSAIMADADTTMADTVDTTAAVPPIQRVPLELLLRITSHLTTPELGNIRLTCRSLEGILHAFFLKEYFYRKQFMMSDDSLQVLVDISKSRLSPHVRKVHFGLEQYPIVPTVLAEDRNRDIRFVERHADMFTLWNTGHHRDMLVEAFRNLKNLEDVVIRSFNSTKRMRDGAGAMWTSYGSTTAGREVGYDIIQGSGRDRHGPVSNQPFASQVFAVVMAALGYAEARPKGIEVMAREQHQLRNFAFNIPPYLEASVVPVIRNLEKLHLDVNITWTGPRPNPQNPPEIAPEITHFLLRKFLSHAVNVKHLRINSKQDERDISPGILKWLASPTNSDVPSKPHDDWLPGPAFPLLEELNLGRMVVDEAWILDILHKFSPTLTRLELVNMALRRPLLSGSASSAETRVSFWSEFLAKLKGVPGLNLHHIALRNLQQCWGTGYGRKIRVAFTKDPEVSYTGSDWKHFVTEMIPLIEVNYVDAYVPRRPWAINTDPADDGPNNADDDEEPLGFP